MLKVSGSWDRSAWRVDSEVLFFSQPVVICSSYFCADSLCICACVCAGVRVREEWSLGEDVCAVSSEPVGVCGRNVTATRVGTLIETPAAPQPFLRRLLSDLCHVSIAPRKHPRTFP